MVPVGNYKNNLGPNEKTSLQSIIQRLSSPELCLYMTGFYCFMSLFMIDLCVNKSVEKGTPSYIGNGSAN